MDALNKHHRRAGIFFPRRRSQREGKIMMVTCISILGLLVLGGFVGNAGHVVTTKVVTQNAADSIAFSSAQWMARGMNAVTATNHLLGEVTALVVCIEAIGGPEANLEDPDQKIYPPEPMAFDEANKGVGELWVPKGGYGAGGYGGVEKPVIGSIIDIISPKEQEDAKFKAFATIYDSKLVIKKDLLKYLLIKSAANVGFLVPMPIGIVTAIAAYITHIVCSYEIVSLGIEYIILEGLELLVDNKIMTTLKVDCIENLVIPALVAHGDFIAGKPPLGLDVGQSGVVNRSIEASLTHLGTTYAIEGKIFPAANKFKMPIEPEPAPSMQGNNVDEEGWGVDENLTTTLDSEIEDKMKEQDEKINGPRNQLIGRRIELEKSINGGEGSNPPGGLNGLEKKLNDKLNADPKPSPEDEARFRQEITEIGTLRTRKNGRIAILNDKITKINTQQAESKGAVEDAKNRLKNLLPSNPSSENIPKELMDQKEERQTQWVRATYPYVDAFRAPILKQFEEYLDDCEAAKHYEKWTNRYTLIKAWKFRSGSELVADSETEAHWEKDQNKKLALYVMKGAYNKDTKRLEKGRESWTADTDQGRREAEEMFTVIGITQRPMKPLFSPVLFPIGVKNGVTTFGQAIFYNGNEQTPGDPNTKQPNQAKVGWDTLNWDPASNTPEWGRPASRSDARWPWEIFSRSPDRVGSSKAKLNWQAKLMPVTPSRFRGAANEDYPNADMNKNLDEALRNFETLVTH